MASPTNSFISGLAGKLGIPGARKYDVTADPQTAFSSMTLKEKLQERVLHFRTIDREQRIRRHTTWYLMALYYQGYQNLDLNPTGNTFDVYEREDFYVENQFRKHVDTVKQMMNKLEGDICCRPGSDSPADIAASRVSDSVLSSMLDTIGYDKVKDIKNLYKCLFGNAFIFTDYVVDKKYGTVTSPKYEYQQVPAPVDPSAAAFPSITNGPMAGLDSIPEDPAFSPPAMPGQSSPETLKFSEPAGPQSPAPPWGGGIKEQVTGAMPIAPLAAPAPMTGAPGTPPEMMMSKVATGFTKRNKGSEIAIVCSPLEINVRADIKGGLENIPYLQWITRQDLDIINYVYPGLNTSGNVSAVEQDLAQQYIETLTNLPGNLTGDSPAYNRALSTKKAELVRTWLHPSTFLNDKELLSQFPTGVHITSVNGLVVDWYEECLTDRWTHEVLIPVPHSMLGDALYDAILMQDQINELNSLLIQHMRYSTVGHKVYDSTVIDPKDVVNDPKNGWIPGKPGLDKTIQMAVKELPPTSLSQDVPAWLGMVKEAMQDMTSAYDPTTGKGIGANTPYSQSVFLNEKAQSRWASSLAYNKPELIHFHRQLLQIARDNWVDPRRRSFQSNTGEWSFEQFTQADLQGQVDIIMSNTDLKPRSRAEQIQGLTMLTTLAPLLPGMPPKQKLRIEEMLGLPPDANPTSNQISRAYRNIDRIKKGEVVTPLPLVDDAMAQLPVFQDFLASEDGESLAEQEPQTFANVYTFMVTLLQMGMMHNSSPAAGMMGQQPPQPPQGQGSPAGEKKPAGGQPGQKGGGPSSGNQPNAQSPAQPAPPVSPPSA